MLHFVHEYLSPFFSASIQLESPLEYLTIQDLSVITGIKSYLHWVHSYLSVLPIYCAYSQPYNPTLVGLVFEKHLNILVTYA